MQIDFYEEFPDYKNLKKLNLIKFPSKLFIAEKSIENFQKWEKYVRKINKKVKCIYWSVIDNSYWISPFSNTKDLNELFTDLKKIENPILIDLEFPLKKKMILKNLFSFFKNKRIIEDFFKKNKKRITTAQYPLSHISFFQKILGLNYNIKTHKSLMWYSSMNSEKLNKKIKKELTKIKNKEDYSVSLGTIAVGVLGNEPILLPEKLEKNLEFVKDKGFNRVIIFRLEGLNRKYLNVINKFIK